MTYVKYHPLVDADTDGTEKVPMFMGTIGHFTPERHRLYLEEIVPYRFRLCSSVPLTAEETSGFTIRCPYCGTSLKAISAPCDGLRHTLYECPDCC